MQRRRKIGVVIPAYREAENIVRLARALLEEARNNELELRVCVVDDSPDLATVEALQRAALPHVDVVHRETKGGRGSAVLEGLRQLQVFGPDLFLEMDADFSHPPDQLAALCREALQRGLDLLIASRYLPTSRIENWPLSRRIFSRCSNWTARRVLGVPVRDYTNGYRVYSPRTVSVILETCGKLGKGFISLSEILVNAYYRGLKVGETPTHFINRVRGESSVTSSEIRGAVVGLGKIWKLKSELKKKAFGTHEVRI